MTVALKSSLNTFIRILLLVSSEYVSASKGTKTLCFYKKYPRWMLYASTGSIRFIQPAQAGAG